MSSFSEVKQAVCQIMKDDGKTHNGTAFYILPGILLTCHHVVFGLKKLLVKIPGEQELYEAEYLKNYSNPEGDFAILKLANLSIPAVQLGRMREDCEVYGYGFRPTKIEQEPEGHSFPGKLGPGQKLKIPVSAKLKDKLKQLTIEECKPWNILPEEFRFSEVRTFHDAFGLEQGISGGPIYDLHLRRIVGLFRAVEGDELAYIIPVNDVFSHWRDLENENRALIQDKPIDRLAQDFGIRLIAEGARKIPPVSRRVFEKIFSAHKIFGGRHNELAVLNAFIDAKKSGYFFVTGPAGFGKTALLANWAQFLESRNVNTAVHFITSHIDGGTEKHFCFNNLCEQLLAFQDLGGDIPRDENLLQLLYTDLVKLPPPPEKRIVVIIDGMDESVGWKFRPDIFPEPLPEGVFVVFSARKIAGRNWLEEVGLSQDIDNQLHLEKMVTKEIADLLQNAGKSAALLANNIEFVEAIFKVSEGDPFYLGFLVEDINNGKITPDNIKNKPIGLNKYLEDWWKEVSKAAREEDVRDLLGYLLVARGPLTRDDLTNISYEDKLDGAVFEGTIQQVQRYLVANEQEGYAFCHPRFHDYVGKERIREHDQLPYRQRLLNYCSHWQQHKSNYALSHYANHLVEAYQTSELDKDVEMYRQELFALGRNREFVEIQRKKFPHQSDLPMKTVQAALLVAAESDDASAMTEFLLLHARLAQTTVKGSPLNACRESNLKQAWELSDLCDPELSPLWYLLLAWELKDSGRLEDALATLKRLLEKELPCLSGWQNDDFSQLFMYALEVNEDIFTNLCQRLLDDSERLMLCRNFIAQDNLNGAIKLKQLIESDELRSLALAMIVVAQAGKKEFVSSIETIQGISYEVNKAKALGWIAAYLLHDGKTEDAENKFAEALEIAQGIGIKESQANALNEIAQSLFYAVKTEDAKKTFAAAIKAAKEIEDEEKRNEMLLEIAKARAKNGEFEVAIEIVHGSYEWDRAKVLVEIAAGQANNGDFDAAIKTAHGIDEEFRPGALGKIAASFLRAGNIGDAKNTFAIALKIAEKIENKVSQAYALRGIVESQAEAKEFIMALENVKKIEDEEQRVMALGTIGAAQSRAGQTKEARDRFAALLEIEQEVENKKVQIESEKTRAWALSDIAIAHVKARNFTAALETIKGIEDERIRGYALIRIGEMLVQAGHMKEAKAAFDLAVETAQKVAERSGEKGESPEAMPMKEYRKGKLWRPPSISITNFRLNYERSQMLRDIALAQAHMHEFDAALKTAQLISYENYWAWAMGEIAQERARVGPKEAARVIFSTAVETAIKIEDKNKRENALKWIAQAQASAGEFTSAFEIIKKIEDEEVRTMTLGWIGAEQRIAGMVGNTFTAALEIAQGIKDEEKRVDALEEIATAQVYARDFTAALETAQKIKNENDEKWVRVIGEIAGAQTEEKLFEDALETARLVHDKYEQTEILVEFIAQRQVDASQTEPARDTLTIAHELVKQIEDEENKELLLNEISSLLAQVEEFDTALKIAQLIKNETDRAEGLGKIAVAQVQRGFGEQALQTMEMILINRNQHLPLIAEALAVANDKKHFKRLLVPCAYYLDNAYKLCGLLAQLYPENANAVEKIVSEFG